MERKHLFYLVFMLTGAVTMAFSWISCAPRDASRLQERKAVRMTKPAEKIKMPSVTVPAAARVEEEKNEVMQEEMTAQPQAEETVKAEYFNKPPALGIEGIASPKLPDFKPVKSATGPVVVAALSPTKKSDAKKTSDAPMESDRRITDFVPQPSVSGPSGASTAGGPPTAKTIKTLPVFTPVISETGPVKEE